MIKIIFVCLFISISFYCSPIYTRYAKLNEKIDVTNIKILRIDTIGINKDFKYIRYIKR
jgi:hypothetical protein